MKIALVRTASNILEYGSYNIQEIGLAKSLLKYGVSTDIYARFSNVLNSKVIFNNIDTDSRVTLKPLKGVNVYREIMYYPNLKKYLCFSDYNIVQLEDDSQIMVPILLPSLKNNGIKTILWQGMYRGFSSKIAGFLQIFYDLCISQLISNKSDLILSKTKQAGEYLKEKGYKNEISLLQVGLNKVAEKKNPSILNEITKFKKKCSKILLYIGAIEGRRNIGFLVEILNYLKLDKFGLIIVGKGPHLNSIKRKVENLGLEKFVLYFDNIPNNELGIVFRNSDMFLLPTKYEIYGMVVLEALFYGIPVISSKEAGPKTILNEEKLGVCLDFNLNEWVEKIKFYTENYNTISDSTYREKYILKNFSWDSIGEGYFKKIIELKNS